MLVLTQWRVGMAGYTGLDYAALYPLLDREAEDDADWQQLFDDVRVLEAEALDVMAEQREKNG